MTHDAYVRSRVSPADVAAWRVASVGLVASDCPERIAIHLAFCWQVAGCP